MKRFLYSTTLIVLALLAGNVGAQHKCPDDTAIFEGKECLKLNRNFILILYVCVFIAAFKILCFYIVYKSKHFGFIFFF